ncbi:MULTISPECIES: GNAT family N-acetyltransferase [unclassified Aureimonas]|uniref:GNAT family N-acetyltransferase n=1 Tax=unclassified Aureimonas TaxID=2615206 RepID=UPI001FCD17D1|nr:MULTISPECIES: N-acetyltransferase [unclassified Aureimonas]
MPEMSVHSDVVAEISSEAFGPGRFSRAAERVREMAGHEPSLSFVASLGDAIVGSVRQSRIAIGGRPAVMLGPLAVRPPFMGRGLGAALLDVAARSAREAGETVILLVGDPPYYLAHGYVPLPTGSVLMPGPADPARLLALPLCAGALEGLCGRVTGREGIRCRKEAVGLLGDIRVAAG